MVNYRQKLRLAFFYFLACSIFAPLLGTLIFHIPLEWTEWTQDKLFQTGITKPLLLIFISGFYASVVALPLTIWGGVLLPFLMPPINRWWGKSIYRKTAFIGIGGLYGSFIMYLLSIFLTISYGEGFQPSLMKYLKDDIFLTGYFPTGLITGAACAWLIMIIAEKYGPDAI